MKKRIPEPVPPPATYLLEHLRNRGIAQRKLARDLDIHPSYASLICNGKRIPSIELGKKIADYLGMTLDDVFGMLKGSQGKEGRSK